MTRDPSANLNPALRAQTFAMREQLARVAEDRPLPDRFSVYPASDGPSMIITDTETMRSTRVPLFAYGQVRESLNELFG